MSLQINLEVDWTEVDGAINRLITAIQPKHVHNLSAKTAYRQVKTKYPERWRSQVNTDSIWQQVKQEIQGQGKGFGSFLTGLGFAGEPGFLTGTTYKSITAESDYRKGRVYPKGRWPQDPDCADLPVTYQIEGQDKVGAGKYFKWNWDGLEFYLGPGYQTVAEKDKSSPSYRREERMTDKKYGAPGQTIDWLFLDDEDINLIVNNVSSLMEYALANNRQGVQSLYRGLRLKESKKAAEEPEMTLETEAPEKQMISFDAHIDSYYDFLEEQERMIQELIKNEMGDN